MESAWLDQWKPNSFLKELKLVEASKADTMLWESSTRAVLDDESVHAAHEDALTALALARAYGTQHIAKDTSAALWEVLKSDAESVTAGLQVVRADVASAKTAALAILDSMPRYLVSLGKYFERVDTDFASALFVRALQHPELRFDALVAQGRLLDEKNPPDFAGSFAAFSDAMGMLVKGAPDARGSHVLNRLSEMSEYGLGTEKNPTMAYSMANLAAAS